MKKINWKRFMFRLGIVMMVIGAIIMFAKPFADYLRIETISKELSDKYGLVIRFGDPSEFHLPPFTVRTNSEEFNIEKAEKSCVLTALEGVKSALAKYPPALVKKYLSAVFVSGEIKSYGVKCGGTYLNSWIYVTTSPAYNRLGSKHYEETLHHELSSLFLYGPGLKIILHEPNATEFYGSNFPATKWHSANRPGFRYLERQIDVIHAAGKFRKPKDAPLWYKDGFVSDYGMTSIENDLNTYAEVAMEHPAKLKELAEKYPRIAAKTRLFMEFYTSLAPEMADYFKSVGLDKIQDTGQQISANGL
ncbi:MAG TPA: hypothetical protein VFG19_13365 [Geobacteraceae bacterium]|nr:hypothetical protein [Geobacteraceae bacterium]